MRMSADSTRASNFVIRLWATRRLFGRVAYDPYDPPRIAASARTDEQQKPSATLIAVVGLQLPRIGHVLLETPFLKRPLRHVDWTSATASNPRCRRSSDAGRAALDPSACCCESGHILRIHGVSRGRRIVQAYRGFSEMVGHSGCGLGFCARGDGFRGDGCGSRKVNRQADDATYRAYRILTHGIFVALVVFFLAGERITWINCLTGFAWRAWLLLYALPSWITALSAPA